MIIAPTRRSYDLKSVQPFDWHEQNIYTVFNTVALVTTQYKCALYGQVLFEWLKTKKCQRSTIVRLFFFVLLAILLSLVSLVCLCVCIIFRFVAHTWIDSCLFFILLSVAILLLSTDKLTNKTKQHSNK